ncbi:MAG: DUF885 domain-containing protein [Longimicrobiales bacterium]
MQLRTIPLIAMAVTFALACGSAPDRESGTPGPGGPGGPGIPVTQDEIDDAAEEFDLIRTGFLEWYFEAHPVRATELGVHDYDHRLPALDRVGIQRRIDDLLRWLSDLEEVRFVLMAGDDRYDYAVLEYGIRSELLELEESRDWANDPGLYTGLIARGLAAVAEREYAPFATRTGALTARMTAAPALLEAVRSNVRQPPRVWTELAVGEARGLLEYLEEDLPTLLRAQRGAIPGELEEARSALAGALQSHIDWLTEDLLARSTGTFRLGRYLLERRLLYDEHIFLGLSELERLNVNAINEYRQQVAEVAETIDPDRSPKEIIDSITRVGPEPEELLPRARAALTTARDWSTESGVVPVPRDALPTVRESPPYARALFASLDAPGPFAPDSLEVFYNLTNVRPGWDEAVRRGHMSYFNDAGLVITTLHTTFPGRYVQQQYARDLVPLRRVLATKTFTAGWAHYATGMALDEGFSDDPAVRLEQLRRALQRHARWFAVVRLHAMDEPLDQVVTGFMEIAYFDEVPARREVLQATRDPGLMADALGRMQILQLRDDYRQHREEDDEPFSLVGFHTELLRLGLPFPLAREVMIPSDPDQGR